MSDRSSRPWLRPGDVIQYYSSCFVAGDSRGFRSATIVKIDPASDPEYPVRINRLELLPLYTQVTRTTTHDGAPCERSFRQLGSYKLLPGEATVPSQEAVLNARLSSVLTEATAAVRRKVGRSKRSQECETSERDSADEGDVVHGAAPAPTTLEGEEMSVAQLPTPPAHGDGSLGRVQTAAQRRQRQKRAKDRIGLQQNSRKLKHQRMRKATRDSKNVYLAKTKAEKQLQEYLKSLNTSKQGEGKTRSGNTE